jgi:hypothetical protein
VTAARQWLESEGYPFEMQVANALAADGLWITQAVYYVDQVTKKGREIDIVGRVVHRASTSVSLTANLVIDCKWAQNQPWLLLP